MGLALGDLSCQCCDTCQPFSGTTPTSVQAELSGNAYSTTGAPANTSNCCSTWSAQVLVRDDYSAAVNYEPNCFSAGFSNELLGTIDPLCVLLYLWGDHTCKSSPGAVESDRAMSVRFVKHPTTGNVWIWALAALEETQASVLGSRSVLSGYLDTGVTSIATGDGPFTVPLTCLEYYDNGPDYYGVTFTRNGCWSTTYGDIIVTP